MGRPKKKRYNRQYMKKHFASETFVSNDGEHIERDIIDNRTGLLKNQTLTMWIDSQEDRIFVLVSGKGKFYVDEMVLSCYRGLMKDGKKYLVHHIDGNMRNSNLRNLEWREATPQYIIDRKIIIQNSLTTSAKKDKAQEDKEKKDWYTRNKVSINKNGDIIQRGKVLTQIDYIYDHDLDWHYHYDKPWVYITIKNKWGKTEELRMNVSKIMNDFGKIIGNPKDFANPVVLYQNFDYLDTTPGNMIWCDASDQRYIDFKKDAHEKVMEKDHKWNCWLSPLSWKSVYGDKEPYRDWSDKKKPIQNS